MPRPTFPHTMNDLVHAVDGPFGLVVGELPDGTIWVLKRDRKGGPFVLTHYADDARTRVLSRELVADRVTALNTMSAYIGLGERI